MTYPSTIAGKPDLEKINLLPMKNRVEWRETMRRKKTKYLPHIPFFKGSTSLLHFQLLQLPSTSSTGRRAVISLRQFLSVAPSLHFFLFLARFFPRTAAFRMNLLLHSSPQAAASSGNIHQLHCRILHRL